MIYVGVAPYSQHQEQMFNMTWSCEEEIKHGLNSAYLRLSGKQKAQKDIQVIENLDKDG